MSERVCAYVDGFNLYYGIRKSGHKWLNIEELARHYLADGDQLVAVKYFTARVRATLGDDGAPRRQQVYLRALRTLPLVELHFGRFSRQTKWMPRADGDHDLVQVLRVEEKGSDVALATEMVADAFRGRFTTALLFSNDSDLCPPMAMVQGLGLRVVVVNPHPNTVSPYIAKMADDHRPITSTILSASQFPDLLRDAKGVITKPVGW